MIPQEVVTELRSSVEREENVPGQENILSKDPFCGGVGWREKCLLGIERTREWLQLGQAGLVAGGLLRPGVLQREKFGLCSKRNVVPLQSWVAMKIRFYQQIRDRGDPVPKQK